jgi:hypothetical protein
MDKGCIHPSQPAPKDCDILPLLPVVESVSLELDPPMYVKFTYRDEWRYIPGKEIYPVWTEIDFALAAITFRKIHDSNGALVVFRTLDLIDWIVWGVLPEEKNLFEKIEEI